MRKSSLLFLATSLFLFPSQGCGDGADPVAPIVPSASGPQPTAAPLVVELTCATAPVGHWGEVYRFEVAKEPSSGERFADWSLAPAHTYNDGLPPPEPPIALREPALGAVLADVIDLSFGEFSLLVGREQGAVAFSGGLRRGGELVAVACWAPDYRLPFRYDPARGQCLDSFGMQGRNQLPIQMVRETGNGECGDFATISLNEEIYRYPILGGWNLRGANLETATLFFAELRDVSLQGAQMTTFEFGYARIIGMVDEHTRLSPDCVPLGGDQAIDCLL